MASRQSQVLDITEKVWQKQVEGLGEWLKALEEAGAECYVWYPHQWDEIAEILRRKPEGISLEVNRVTCQKMTGVASGTTVETSEGERA